MPLLMFAGNQAAPSTPWPTDGCVASHVEWRGLSASVNFNVYAKLSKCITCMMSLYIYITIYIHIQVCPYI